MHFDPQPGSLVPMNALKVLLIAGFMVFTSTAYAQASTPESPASSPQAASPKPTSQKANQPATSRLIKKIQVPALQDDMACRPGYLPYCWIREVCDMRGCTKITRCTCGLV